MTRHLVRFYFDLWLSWIVSPGWRWRVWRAYRQLRHTRSRLVFASEAANFACREAWPALLQHAQIWITLHPEDAEGWLYSGWALGMHGRDREAADSFRRCLWLDPGHCEAQIFLKMVR
jgi:cytochrome c-type biogenesis protein CcmH/NrfG